MSGFLDMIGLGMIDLGIVSILLIIAVIVLAVLVILQNGRIRRLSERCDSFMQDDFAGSFENDIIQMYSDHKMIRTDIDQDRQDITDLDARLASAIQKVGVVKYDAFNHMGGNLSYALALLNEYDDGLILNSVQSVDGSYSYCKIVQHGKPDVDLGREERLALNKALGLAADNNAAAGDEEA